ncbi:FAD-dependent oxidoreductase, partial [Akkermansiaceae bacterium]|nr:FAD-dependent oxidoreductase [Akkermansiaceae bacterium]
MKFFKSFFVFSLTTLSSFAQESHKADIIVYGGTSAGVIAAVQAKQMGKSVIIVSPDKHLGGLSSGGLGWTDTGKKDAVGGLSRNFYERVFDHYQNKAAWNWQPRDEYTGSGTRTIDNGDGSMWMFEPHVAEKIFEDHIKENEITVHRDQWLDRKNGVVMTDNRITQITTLSKNEYQGKIFIDAT